MNNRNCGLIILGLVLFGVEIWLSKDGDKIFYWLGTDLAQHISFGLSCLGLIVAVWVNECNRAKTNNTQAKPQPNYLSNIGLVVVAFIAAFYASVISDPEITTFQVFSAFNTTFALFILGANISV